MMIDAKKVQNRHILTMLGIGLWSGKKSATTHVGTPQDRLSNPRLEHLLVRQQTTSAPTRSLATKPIPMPVVPKKAQTNKTAAVLSKAKVADTHQQAPTVALQTQYHLQGVRYDQWILVVDMLLMDTKARSVWLSLCQALAQHAQKNAIAYHTHQVQYPFVTQDDYLEHQSLSPSQDVFLGFMFRLSLAVKHTNTQVAFLTALPKGISYPNLYQLPSIDDMIGKNALKKQLWEVITSKNQPTQNT